MAQTGVVLLTVNAFPKGQDETQRRELAYGTCAINTSSATPIAITAWSITSNVLTLTAANSLTTGGGQSITVSGFTTSTFLNGVYTTSSATSTTIVVPLTHTNGSATEAGSAVLTPEYVTGGLPLTWTAMVDGNFNAKPYSGLWGPNQTQPKTVSFFSVGGGLTTLPGYQYIYDTTNNTLRILSNGTELTNAAVITPDSIGFEAEWIKNGY
jgi:hypothetical protein